MKAIRRIYLYAVSFVSMEIVLWGMINLARSSLSHSIIGATTRLAQALALVFVGVPVFGFHWLNAQRLAKQDAEESASRVRAFFLYATLLSLFVPVIQNLWRFINTVLLRFFKASSSLAVFGGTQSLLDNIIAILMNGILALYFLSVLTENSKHREDHTALRFFRHIYRHLLMLYALGISLFGVTGVLSHLFSQIGNTFGENNHFLANGLASILIGVPLWVWTWKILQKNRHKPEDKETLLRLGVLYALSFLGVLVFLISFGLVLNQILLLLFQKTETFNQFIRAINGSLAASITFGTLWAYYGYWRHKDVDALPNTPRRAALHRLYTYVLAFLGLAAAFTGTSLLISFIIDSFFQPANSAVFTKTRLASALSTLFIGFPLWLKFWSSAQTEALNRNEEGAHARRSAIRKTYLYLLVFIGVVGGMISAVTLSSLIFEALLNALPDAFWENFLNDLLAFLLFVGLSTYHWKTIRKDTTLRKLNLAEAEKPFTALVLDDEKETLLPRLASLTEAEVKKIDLIPQNPNQPPPPADALILPFELLLSPSETLIATLRDFDGIKLIFTRDTEEWHWAQSPRQIAEALRALSEGEKIRKTKKNIGWMTVVYILAGITALEILFFLSALLLNI